jgi:hypothetical protein
LVATYAGVKLASVGRPRWSNDTYLLDFIRHWLLRRNSGLGGVLAQRTQRFCNWAAILSLPSSAGLVIVGDARKTGVAFGFQSSW